MSLDPTQHQPPVDGTVSTFSSPPGLAARIVIHHAYNGILYFPLFLANELRLLPNNTQLIYSASDEAATAAVRTDGARDDELSLAICDPFVGRLYKVTGRGVPDRLSIVASFITGIPVWVLNEDQNFETAHSLDELRKHAAAVRAIFTYQPTTTGHIIAEFIKHECDMKPAALVPCAFGEEFNAGQYIQQRNTGGDQIGLNQVLHVTSDALRVMAFPKPNRITFNLASATVPGLTPYMFTAVVTRESMLRRFLPQVLGVLSALRAAVLLARDGLPTEHLRLLDTIFQRPEHGEPFAKMGFSGGAEDRQRVIAHALHDLVDVARIYRWLESPPSSVDLAHAWRNADRMWERFRHREPQHIEEHSQPVPSLLLTEDWDARLQSHYLDPIKVAQSAQGLAKLLSGLAHAWGTFGWTAGIAAVGYIVYQVAFGQVINWGSVVTGSVAAVILIVTPILAAWMREQAGRMRVKYAGAKSPDERQAIQRMIDERTTSWCIALGIYFSAILLVFTLTYAAQ